ncbi:MAG: HNH endonuclease [Sedimentitalea sp.]
MRHRCDNRRCVNPDHMELGDRAQNHWDDEEFRANGVDPQRL